MTVGIVGLGLMGRAMAGRPIDAGLGHLDNAATFRAFATS